MQEIIFGSCAAHGTSVDKEFRLGRIAHDVDIFLHAGQVVPMSHDEGFAGVVLHPSAPHDTVGPIALLGCTHGIHHSAYAIVELTAVVGVGFRENNLHAAR